MYAAHFQSPEIIATLLEAGADTNAKDIAGRTAFHYAQDNEKLKGTDAYRQLQKASK
jgi:ankyrin repeat protein